MENIRAMAGLLNKLFAPSPAKAKIARISYAADQKQWHAVGVITGESPCVAIQLLRQRRWLSAEAPRFPLPNCNSPQCDCHYSHFKDRRAGPRRTVDNGGFPAQYSGPQRRSERRGRRSTDFP
jgi:hypothetical protein